MFEQFKAWVLGVLKSWTMWFNSMVLVLVGFAAEITAALPQLQMALSPETYGKLLLGVTVVNILLRMKTNSSLHDK